MSGNPLLDLAAKEQARKDRKPVPPAEPLDQAFQTLGVKGGLKHVQKANQKEDSLRPNGLGDARRVAASRVKLDPATHDVLESALYMNSVDGQGNLIQPDTPAADVWKYSVKPEIRDAIIAEFKANPTEATKKYAAQRQTYRDFRAKTLGPSQPSAKPKTDFMQNGQVPAPLDPEQAQAESLTPFNDPFKQSAVDSRPENVRLDEAARELAKHGEDIGGGIAKTLGGNPLSIVNPLTPFPQVNEAIGKFVGGTAAAVMATPATFLSAIDYAADESHPPLDRTMSFINAMVQAEGAVGGPVSTQLFNRAIKGGYNAVKAVLTHITPQEAEGIAKAAGIAVQDVEKGIQSAKQAIEDPQFDRKAFTKQLQEKPLEVGQGAIEKPAEAPETGKPFTVTAYRGTGSNLQKTSGTGEFFTPDPVVAKMYAGESGSVEQSTIHMQNPLVAQNWVEAKKALGLPQDTNMPGLTEAARLAGHDGVVFENHNGKPEYVVFREQANPTPPTLAPKAQETPNAIQEQTASKSVLRQEEPQLGLQEMGQGNPRHEVFPQGPQAEAQKEITPKETPKPPEPPQTGVQAAKTPIPEGTTALHAEAQTYVDEFGVDIGKSKQSWGESLAEARRSGATKKALGVAKKSLEEKTPLSQTEKFGILDRLHGLRQERSVLAQKIASGTATDLERSEYADLTDQGATLYKALFKSGSETGRALNAQKAWLEGPIDDIHLTAKWSSKLGRDLTPSESEAIKALSDKHAEVQKQLDDAIERISKLEAQRTLDATARRAPRTGKTFNRTVTKDEAKEALKRLGTVVQPGQLGAGLGGVNIRWNEADSEALRTVVKYVYEDLAEKGTVALDTITESVRKLVPDTPERRLDDVTLHQAIRDALGAEGRSVNRGRTYGEDVLSSGTWAAKHPDVAKLRAKLDGIKQEADSALAKALEDQKWAEARGLQKARLVSKDFLQSSRTLMTTLDDSAVGRQSWLVALTNPRSWLKGVANHWKGVTHAGYEAALQDLRAGSGFELGQQSGLKMRSVVGEEMYGGRMLQHIPGVKQAVNLSERLFDLQTDFASQHAFDSMVRLTGADLQEAKVYAEFVNTLTGKTNFSLGDADVMLFAPKFAWSRFKALNAPYFVAKAVKAGYAEGGVKQAIKAGVNIAYQYAKAGAMLTSLFAAAQAGGWKVGTDPSSAEFGKIRKGDFVVDLTAGESQAAVFAYRLWSSMMGKPRYFRNSPVSPWDETTGFLRKKLAPLPSIVTDLGSASSSESRQGTNNLGEGKDVTGQDVTLKDEMLRALLPLGVTQQTGLKSPSAEDRFWSAMAETFGYGTSQYPEKTSTARKGRN